jgi:hypothetical protein
LRTPGGCKQHNQLQHPTPPEHVRRDPQDLIGVDGRRFCVERHPAKVVYDSIESAWLWAFIIFSERGFILTPYYCGDVFFSSTKLEMKLGHPIYLGKRYNARPKIIKSVSERRIFGCGRWHLTNRTNILNP